VVSVFGHFGGTVLDCPCASSSKRRIAEITRQGILPNLLGISPQFLPIIDIGTFAGLWLLHGFAIGQVFALACRKTVVAGFLSIGACLAVAAFWLPSVLYGGLHFWQILGAPVVLLVGSRLAYWPWIGNRILTWRPIATLITCGVLGVAWIGCQLAYRVFEVPTTAQQFNRAEFVAELPTAEKNVAGRLLIEAGKELRTLQSGSRMGEGIDLIERENLAPKNNRRPVRVNEGNLGAPSRRDMPPVPEREVASVLAKGWRDPKQLGSWLNRLFDDDWEKSAEKVREASNLPLGLLIDPTGPQREINYETAHNAFHIARIFVVRGRQLQAREDYDKALEHYFHALAVSRHMRNQAILMAFQRGLEAEGLAERALDSWLNELALSKAFSDSKRLTLLRRAIDGLTAHVSNLPSLHDSLKAEHLVSRSMIYDPDALNDFMGSENRSIALRLAGRARLMVALPWELNRVDRLLDALFAGWERSLLLSYPDLVALTKTEIQVEPGQHSPSQPTRNLLSAWSPPTNDASGNQARERLTSLINQSWLREAIAPRFSQLVMDVPKQLRSLRVVQIKMAIEAYRSSQENRSSPKSLKDLVPGLLSAVPIDPYTGSEFTQTDFVAPMEQPKEDPGSGQTRPGGRLRMINDR
jgi:tetratricopeptide (TPR) repeat protein